LGGGKFILRGTNRGKVAYYEGGLRGELNSIQIIYPYRERAGLWWWCGIVKVLRGSKILPSI
jgi:hypothetical protein